MSFQLYLQNFSAGEPAGFTRDAIRHAFAGMLVELEEDYWQVGIGPSRRADLFLSFLEDGSERIRSLSIEHASTDARLWQAVWTLLGLPGSVFHFPGSTTLLARDPGAASALPPGLLEALGQPTLIASIENLQRTLAEHVTDGGMA